MTPSRALVGLVAVLIAGTNLAYWHWVVRRGEEGFRKYVERTLGVVIRRSTRWHWSVSREGQWLADRGIELLQLAFFLAAFAAWGVAVGVCVALLGLLA